MNVDWAPGGRQPPDQANRLDLWVRRKWAATIHIHSLGWYSFYRPTKGGRLSRFKHSSKGAQPVPKAVCRSCCRDKHNRPQCDSNRSPLTLQSVALTARLLWPSGNHVRRVLTCTGTLLLICSGWCGYYMEHEWHGDSAKSLPLHVTILLSHLSATLHLCAFQGTSPELSRWQWRQVPLLCLQMVAVLLLVNCLLYTVSQKKTRHQTLAHNFPKC